MVASVIAMQMEEIQAIEELEIELLLEGVYRRFGHDFRGYRRESLKHKLHALMQSKGIRTVSALQEHILHQPEACNALLHALTARQVSLFDNPEYCNLLRHTLGVWLRSCPAPKIWLAECGSAEEIYSLAILLSEEQLYEKTQIYATSANEVLLHEAKSGIFDIERFARFEDHYRRSGGGRMLTDYVHESDNQLAVAEHMRSNITWAQYSLAANSSFNEFELIVCRNALAEFGKPLRQRTLQLFHESLSLFGILSIDGADGLEYGTFAPRYKPISRDQGLYRRVM
jgi:chemotaxis protein methyltransferase CheR